MARRLFGLTVVRLLVAGVLATFVIAIFSGVFPGFAESKLCNCPQTNEVPRVTKVVEPSVQDGESEQSLEADFQAGKPEQNFLHSLCVLVPFRDRFEELLEFAPYIHQFLSKQAVKHTIVIINQLDTYRFNRASLLNAGFLETRNKCDYIAMHDVDLLPQNDELRYDFPEHGPFHLASPFLHPIYHYKSYVGGILLIQSKHFELLNGLSNKYWGWGKEDDEFFVRMRKAKLTLRRPANLTTGYKSFRHIHDRRKRPRDNKKFFDQYEQTRRLDKVTGLTTVKYALDSTNLIVVDEAPVTILNVYLECDLNFTPWCLKEEDHGQYKPKNGFQKQ